MAIARGNPRHYAQPHPGSQDLALVVEVADATLEQDRRTKLRIYARAGIAVYWIVNLNERLVEVYSKFSGPASLPQYAHRQDYRATDSIPFIIDGREVGRVSVQDILP